MNPELIARMRAILLDRYGLDIGEARVFYSTQNYAFVFSGKPYMIRVSMAPKKSRAEVLSELMWVDDLKQFKQTICEPNPSLQGKLLEEFEIDGTVYRASMFRAARGSVEPTARMTPMFFICVGDLLGTIHHVSTNERQLGIRYKRRELSGQFRERLERVAPRLEPGVLQRIRTIEERVNRLPQAVGSYGICHGDFHSNNFFVESNNVWLFDFDSCCYAHYLYDVACFVLGAYMFGYRAGEDCRRSFYEEMLPYLKLGYELNHTVDAHYWDDMELLLAYRAAYTLLALTEIDDCGVVEIDGARRFFQFILSQDDLLDAMTTALSAQKAATPAPTA